MIYKLSELAENDLKEILSYSFENFGLERAEKYYFGLKKCCSLIGDYPEIGRLRPDIDALTRSFVHESHVIYYEIQPKRVFILRVLGEKQDPMRHLKTSEMPVRKKIRKPYRK